MKDSPLFIDVQKSKLNLYFLVAVHALAMLSILLVTDSGVVGLVIKAALFVFILFSFKSHLKHYKNDICITVKSDSLVDLSVADKVFHDLRFSTETYISTFLLQLILLDDAGSSHKVTLFPDSIDAAMHSKLRARLKLAAKDVAALL